MKELANLTFKITHSSQQKLKLKIRPVLPKDNLRDGFDEIPSLSWIKIEKTEGFIEPQNFFETDILISIPDKKEYFGKKYQVNIEAETIPVSGSGGVKIGLAVESIILITTAEKIKKTKLKKVDLSSIEIDPKIFILKDIEVGKIQKVGVLKITNNAKRSFKIKINPVLDKNIESQQEYEICKNINCLKINNPEFFISPKETKEVELFLDIPYEYANKNLMFLVSVSQESKNVCGEYYIKILVSTK